MNLKDTIVENWYGRDYTVLEMEGDVMKMFQDLIRDVALTCDTETAQEIIEKIVERGGYKTW